MNPEDISCWTL